jgi:hypothetical protein
VQAAIIFSILKHLFPLQRASLNAMCAAYKAAKSKYSPTALLTSLIDGRCSIHSGLGVLDLSLPEQRWTHAAHFAVALWLIFPPPLGRARSETVAFLVAF